VILTALATAIDTGIASKTATPVIIHVGKRTGPR
jgi:hypothetical protein